VPARCARRPVGTASARGGGWVLAHRKASGPIIPQRSSAPVERPQAELAHVAERLWLDRVVEAGMTVEDPEAMAGKPSSFPLRNPQRLAGVFLRLVSGHEWTDQPVVVPDVQAPVPIAAQLDELKNSPRCVHRRLRKMCIVGITAARQRQQHSAAARTSEAR
jgi:hypothetical protein